MQVIMCCTRLGALPVAALLLLAGLLPHTAGQQNTGQSQSAKGYCEKGDKDCDQERSTHSK